MHVHSHPHDVWFSTEVEAITDGLLTERNATTECDVAGSKMHTLTQLAVRVLAWGGEPFTAYDIWQVIEHREIPIPQETTPADLEAVWRRLRRRIEQSRTARTDTGGQP
jgi:hypothetical protein